MLKPTKKYNPLEDRSIGIRKGDLSFVWDICVLCGTMVCCPVCGNNSCNGGSGEVKGKKCKTCRLVHQYTSMACKTGCEPTVDQVLATWPKRKAEKYRRMVKAMKARRIKEDREYR